MFYQLIQNLNGENNVFLVVTTISVLTDSIEQIYVTVSCSVFSTR